MALITLLMDNPSGYGRIVRDATGAVVRIVEQKDANDEEKKMRDHFDRNNVSSGQKRSEGWLHRVARAC